MKPTQFVPALILACLGVAEATAEQNPPAKVDGVTVSWRKDLLNGTISGTDMYGNEYGVDAKGKLGKPGEFRMLREQIGTEKVAGVTVTKMKNLLDGSITGTDMYGQRYVTKGGKLVAVK